MQIVKFFTYELPFLKRLREVRNKELGGVRTILIIRAANQAIAFSVPVSDLLFVIHIYLTTMSDYCCCAGLCHLCSKRELSGPREYSSS